MQNGQDLSVFLLFFSFLYKQKTPPDAQGIRGCWFLSFCAGFFVLGAKIKGYHHRHDHHYIIRRNIATQSKHHKHADHQKGDNGFDLAQLCNFLQNFLHIPSLSKSARRWLITLICSSTTGIRRAKPLCSRTSRVNSSILVSVTAWEVWILLAVLRAAEKLETITPTRDKPPEISATRTASLTVQPPPIPYPAAASRSCCRR